MTLALVMVMAASIAYLQPPPPRITAVPATEQRSGVITAHNSGPAVLIAPTGGTDGGYFVWTDSRNNSGGHAS